MTTFGTLADGTLVERLTLSAGDVEASILTLGALLQDVRLSGVPHGLTLGSPDLAAYLGPMQYFGPVVGPVANRIGGATTTIDGTRCQFEANFGPHTLHSGSAGVAGKVWRIAATEAASATLGIDLPHGEGGFPGNRSLRARWSVAAPAIVTLEVTATTDAPTIMMIAHHPYWNLDGSDTWQGHRLRVDADRYLPCDDVALPTGQIAAADRTRFDFRTGRAVPFDSAYDNTLCLADRRRGLTPVARLEGSSGLCLDIATTEPALHVYDGSGADASSYAGHDGRRHGPRAGLALEPQFWPDATNNPAFPDITMRPGEPWRHYTRYTFSL